MNESPCPPATPEPDVTFVLIVSKLCNLRCSYCYEFPDLANRRRMSPGDLERVFEAVVSHYAGHPPLNIRFAWQGGEPLLHDPAFFREALAGQRRAFAGCGHRITNVVQTNLTTLDDSRIALLRECFDGVGVSHDVAGGLRVDVGGRVRDARTVANLDRLMTAGVPLGGITVLSRGNHRHIDEIYRFWRDRSLPFRLLPVHRGPAPKAGEAALGPEEVLAAYRRAVDLWLDDDNGAPELSPITEMIVGILRRHGSAPPLVPYDRGRREWVLIVDPGGFVGGVNELLDLEHAYGNILQSSIAELLASEGHRRAVGRSQALMGATCTDCPFFRTACAGHPMGDSGKEFVDSAGTGAAVCIARGTLAYIERRLEEAGVIDAASGDLCAEMRGALRPAAGQKESRAW